MAPRHPSSAPPPPVGSTLDAADGSDTTLPTLPAHRVESVSVDILPAPMERSFARLAKHMCQVRFEGGEVSAPFSYDIATRSRLDAVVVVPHYQRGGERFVVLRSALRPPVALRPREVWPVPEPSHLGALWEVIAGLVEEDERSEEGLRRCAARELHEEGGFELAPSQMQPLGPSSFPAPGLIGERHFFFHAEVDPAEQATPPEDGSALERDAKLAAVTLSDSLRLCRAGAIEDAKTELALRRLADLF